ncbi:UNVERIFIED_CONTAM: hypothetical protein GTU68_028019 [Idotea baltica]|nr:hypothetical protein [Idotea baltica]
MFDATRKSPICLQWDHLFDRGVVGHEDCLFLNIYTNFIPTPPAYFNTQPILVLLHAGTWSASVGDSDVFDHDYLLQSHVVVITLNHRLGPFGFLTTESKEAPGNYGLMDQILALEWIRDNSRYFGGMNDSVTIMGSGAGGISSHLLTLSPKARGASTQVDEHVLFHRAISQSGTAYSPHAIVRSPIESTKKLAAKMKCKMENVNSFISCLQIASPKKIAETLPTLYEWDDEPLLFGPVIDKAWMGEDALIPDEPHHLIKHSQMLQVPWIVGNNINDAAYKVYDILEEPSLVKQLNLNWEKYGPILLHLTKHSCKDPVGMANQIRDFYMGKEKFGEHSASKFIEMMTDRFFLYPTERASQDHSEYLQKSKQYIYRYILTFKGQKNFVDLLHRVNPADAAKSIFGM